MKCFRNWICCRWEYHTPGLNGCQTDFKTGVVPMKMFKEGFKEFKYLLKLVAFYVLNGYEEFGIKL